MKLAVREMQECDIEPIVDYFVLAETTFLEGMGVDKSKLPSKESWMKKLEDELRNDLLEKEFYFMIWLLDKVPVGHSNINQIKPEESACMHLHLWQGGSRRKGMGLDFLKLCIPNYFKSYDLKTLICEPYAMNVAPNKVVQRLGFDFIRTYDTTPGWINFHQSVNRYELSLQKAMELGLL